MDTIYSIMLELRKKYKSGSAVEIIKNAILLGEISGEIGQNEFAESLGISRIPVREALIALEYHGLIKKLPNQHVIIIDIDEKSIRDLFTDMSLIELEVIKNLNAENLASLSSLTQSDFHRELYGLTASPLRRAFLKIITETYIMFVMNHSDSAKINTLFVNLKRSLEDIRTLREVYEVYAEALAAEIIRIRKDYKENFIHAES